MNRREAIAALVALPHVERIAKVDAQPTDVIVVECDTFVSAAAAERIRLTLNEVWPNRKVVICDKNMRIKVVGG